MITCASCGATNADGLSACARCAKPISRAGAGASAQNAMQDQQLLREVEDRQRLRRRRKIHAVTGAATFFLINILLGLPMSLRPVSLITNLITSLVFGLPIGWIISWQQGGVVRGALLSAGTFIVVRLILGGFAVAAGEQSGSGMLISALAWGIAGIIPGAFIGFHVESDH
ncbi:MAG: hypothetical protein HY293_16660 [Planctomycetes bacterium]|nr:hypothetical protein [Planctomycetota bacterium]